MWVIILLILLANIVTGQDVITSNSPTNSPILNSCNSFVIDTSKPSPYGCPSPECQIVNDANGQPISCGESSPCDIQLNYTLPRPYGCKADLGCILVRDSVSGIEQCAVTGFWDFFAQYYYGNEDSFAFGFMFFFLKLFKCLIHKSI